LFLGVALASMLRSSVAFSLDDPIFYEKEI
jgi:hypothetical protein